MDEVSSNLGDQTKFRLIEINKIKYYFHSEIQERKVMSKKLSKYIVTFGHFDKTLIVWSPTREGVSIISFTTAGASAGIENANFYSCIFFDNRNNKKIIKYNKK